MNNQNVQVGVDAEIDKVFDMIIRNSHVNFTIDKQDNKYHVCSNGFSISMSYSRIYSFVISHNPYLAIANPYKFELCVLTNADCDVHLFKLIESEDE